MGDTGSTSLETAQQDLEGVIAKFSNRINELEEKLKFFSEYYDKYIKHSELVRVYELGLAEQTRRRQALEKAMAGKTEHDQQISAAKSQVWAAKRLLEINDKAATDSIDATIDQINSYAQPILDKFFPDEGTTVRILNGVTTGSGEHRDKLGIEVWHKGKKAKKLSSLSFGEQSRVLMAFQLALAEMYKSPILMVDEGFTGVDLETKDECLGILKEFSSDRMILVVEHGASEYLFDHVIRIEGGIND
jgi:DNA repair exonuclease SbcCD ATPase subunit